MNQHQVTVNVRRRGHLLMISLLVLALLFGYVFGNVRVAFDTLCIKGRLSAEQAEAINRMEWEHTPSYCDTRKGRSDCRVRKYDRVLRAECSEFMKKLSGNS